MKYFVDAWFELILKLVPESKKKSAKILLVCKFVAMIVLLYQLVALIAGAFMLANITGLEMPGFMKAQSIRYIGELQ